MVARDDLFPAKNEELCRTVSNPQNHGGSLVDIKKYLLAQAGCTLHFLSTNSLNFFCNFPETNSRKHLKHFGGLLQIPSWKLTYPLPKVLLKMIFLFPRWDMLVP